MLVHYICKECGAQVAATHADGSSDARLGLHALTPAERARVLSRQGDVLTVHTYCDGCAGTESTARPGGHHLH